MSATEGITNSVVDLIGNTPLVRLHRLPTILGLECEVLAKCEFFNPGGSVKDRIAKKMVEDAEESGKLKKGDKLVEASSGNTGIGLALVCSSRGYDFSVTMPVKMSQEKSNIMEKLGATIIRTPNVAFDHPESLIQVAKKMRDEEGYKLLDQYNNESNPAAHEFGTAEEIFKQTGGKLDVIVIATGTGGTLTGIARGLKKRLPGLHVVGVDPVGSILAEGVPLPDPKPYEVEGIGYDFIPNVLDRSLVDEWVKTTDEESFKLARGLMQEEGLLVGGSSGAAMAGVKNACKKYGKDKRVVVILPDGIRNYMTKFCCDTWMNDRGLCTNYKTDEESKN